MSDGELLVSEGEESQTGEYLVESLPPWMATDPRSGNFKLLDVVGRLLDRQIGEITDLDHATTVQEAESVEQLEELALLVDLPHETGESLSHYRDRTVSEFQMFTSEGSLSEIMGNMAMLLDIDVNQIGYENLSENGLINLQIPKNALDESSFTGDEISDRISRQAAAGFRIDTTVRGTFTYLAESAYSGPYDSSNGGYDTSQLDSDASIGYDGLAAVTYSFTDSTLDSVWTLNGGAVFDDTNDRVTVNPSGTSTSGNTVYEDDIGETGDWTVSGDVTFVGGAHAFDVTFYASTFGTDEMAGDGYSVEFDNFDDAIRLIDNAAGTTLAETLVTVPDSGSTNSFEVDYQNGTVSVLMNGTEHINHTISNPDRTANGLGFGGWSGSNTGAHHLENVTISGQGDPKGNGGTYAGLI